MSLFIVFDSVLLSMIDLPTEAKRLSIYGSSFISSYLLKHHTKTPSSIKLGGLFSVIKY